MTAQPGASPGLPGGSEVAPQPPAQPLLEGPGPRRADVTEAGFWLYALHLWSVFGIFLSNLFVFLTALASFRAVDWARVPWRRLSPALFPFTLYLFFLLVSIVGSYDPPTSFRATGELSSLAAFFFALVLVRGETRVRRVVDGLLIVTGLVAVFGLGQFLDGYGGLHQRIRGPFSHYMTFAGVLLIVDLLLLAQIVYGGAWRCWWRWLVLGAINLGLVGSLTRSAWVALLLSFTVLVLARAPRFVLAYAPAGLLFLLLAPVPVVHRAISIFDLQDVSNYDRLCMAEAGLNMISERPLLGLGPELVKERYPIYRHPTAPRREVPHLHNSFLNLAAERGLPALAAYTWLVAASLWLALRRFRLERARGGTAAELYMGAFLGIIAFNLAGIFENNWGDSEVQRVALFLMAMPYCLAMGDPK